MKKLPKIYQNDITRCINNNKKVCYLKDEEQIEEEQPTNLDETLNEIFNGIGNSYNIPVEIITKNRKYQTSLISKTDNYIITLDNEIISLSDIVDIKIKKKKVL